MSTVGDVLAGRYRLQRRVGSGAMGVVWQALDERLNRTVAVKQLLVQPDPGRADQARLRAMREGRIAARLQHPNAVAVYDVVVDDGLPVLVMEYLPSRSLADLIAAHGRLDPAAVAGIGAQAATGLAAAHAAGIVHRDVKPANVLIADDVVKITDFGISRAAGDGALTQTGMVAGTPAFLAPEVAQGHQATPSSDVFSLGASLYAAVEGRPPFGDQGENPLALLRVVAAGEVPAPVRAGALAPVLAGMLAADPAERLTAAQAADGLRAVASGQPPPGILHPWPTAPVQRGPSGTLLDNQPVPVTKVEPPRRRRWYLAAGAVAAVVAGALLLASALSSGTDPAPRPPTDADLERVVAEYYELLPDRPESAWRHLGPGLRKQGKEAYVAQWDGVSGVRVISPPRATGRATVHVGVELVQAGGVRVREFHQFGLLTSGRTPLLNSDTVLHTERITPPPEPREDDKPKDGDKKDEEKDREKEEEKKDEGKDDGGSNGDG